MTQNLPQDPKVKTTLIGQSYFANLCTRMTLTYVSFAVCPTALLHQWKEEIHDHTDGDIFSVLIYHTNTKKTHTTPASLRKYDVVLTTYGMLVGDNPIIHNDHSTTARKKKRKEDDFVTSDSEAEDDRPRKVKRKAGPLHQIEWYRVSSASCFTKRLLLMF